jgi:uncharacterized protein YndB with AHSA1/START domain
MIPDRIEKSVFLKASRARVFQALTNSDEFATWFGMKFDRPFTEGAVLKGTVVGTKVDPEVAEKQKPYEGKTGEITIETIEPERLFSFRWHPHAMEPGVDYSKEPTTLVTFVLEDAPGGILLKVTESGFDRIPLERREDAFKGNEGGWTLVVTLIEKYLARGR